MVYVDHLCTTFLLFLHCNLMNCNAMPANLLPGVMRETFEKRQTPNDLSQNSQSHIRSGVQLIYSLTLLYFNFPAHSSWDPMLPSVIITALSAYLEACNRKRSQARKYSKLPKVL